MKGWKKSLLIGFVIALTSEFYLSFFVSNFRISPSVVIFPILLMTIGIEVPVIPNAVVTSCLIFVSRLAVQLFSGVSAKTAVITVLPATFFYTTYGIMFRFMVRDRYGATIPRVTVSAFFCDFLSNIIELQLQEYFQNVPMTMDNALKLLAIAGIRSGLVCGFLMLIRWYRTILTLEEHEKRYQRMYLLTTSLKGEIYLMRQNTGQIERVMGNAYRLYEELLARDMPQEMQQMGLDIAREVHEIKKNYLRIIQGIEEELGREPEDEDIWLLMPMDKDASVNSITCGLRVKNSDNKHHCYIMFYNDAIPQQTLHMAASWEESEVYYADPSTPWTHIFKKPSGEYYTVEDYVKEKYNAYKRKI